MGAQGNTCIMNLDNKKYKYIYTHYLGDELPILLKRALSQTRGYWDDWSYLIAAIGYEILRRAEYTSSGFGLAEYPFNTSQEIIFIDVNNWIITIGSHSLSFGEYIEQDDNFLKSLVLSEKVS